MKYIILMKISPTMAEMNQKINIKINNNKRNALEKHDNDI